MARLDLLRVFLAGRDFSPIACAIALVLARYFSPPQKDTYP